MLKALYYATPQKRQDILSYGSPDFIQTLCESALNILKGNVPLFQSQFNKLKKQKKIIRLLADKRTGLKRKRQTLMKQSGGFLLPMLSTVVPFVGDLIRGLVRRG